MANKVLLIGRLGKDPEVRSLESGSMCKFPLATDESYKDRNGNKVEQTEWHNIVIWKSGLVQVAEKWLNKGSQLYVEGKLKTRSWDDQDGNKKYMTEVVVDNFEMLGGKNSNTAESSSGNMGGTNTQPQQSSQESPAEQQSDDLPF